MNVRRSGIDRLKARRDKACAELDKLEAESSAADESRRHDLQREIMALTTRIKDFPVSLTGQPFQLRMIRKASPTDPAGATYSPELVPVDDSQIVRRSGRWFLDATREGLTSAALREAVRDGRLEHSDKPEGVWRHSTAEVMGQWPGFAPLIQKRLEREKRGSANG